MRPSKSFLLIVLIAAVLLFIRLGATTLFQVAEARNSQVPVEMMQRNDYLVPWYNDEIRTDKPPLHYYAMLMAYRLVGTNETSARLFSAVCGLMVIIATWLFAQKNMSPGVALWSCIMLLASTHSIFQFRLATPDPYLIACHVLSLYCFWEGFKYQKRIFIFLMHLFLGLAILAKGPVGFVLPTTTIFLFLLFRKELSFKTIGKLHPIAGLMMIAAIALPWFYLVHQETGGFWTQGFFIEHNIGRFSEPVDGHKGPFILSWTFVLLGLFPFSIFSIRAIATAWKNRKINSWLFFNLLAAAVIILTYSLSATKLLNYTSPAYPFIALVTGASIYENLNPDKTEKKLLPEWIILLLLSFALPVVIYFWMRTQQIMQSITSLSFLFFILPASTLAGFFYYRKMRLTKAFYTVAAGFIIMNAFFFIIFFPALDSRGSVRLLQQTVKTERRVVAYRKFNDAFTFYHQRPIPVLGSAGAVVEFLKQDSSALILERASQPHLMDSIKGLFIKARAKDLFSRQYSFVYELKPGGRQDLLSEKIKNNR